MSNTAVKTGSAASGKTDDGGQAALAGFLFQFLAAACGFILRLDPKMDTEDGGYELLLTFEHEAAGQDYADTTVDLRGRRRRTLTQCKYSGRPGERKIEPQELEEVVAKLLKSQEAADRTDRLNTHFVLKTNRLPSPETRRILDVIEGKAADDAHLRYRNGRPETPRNREIVEGLRRLSWQSLDPTEARERLASYASRFGVDPGRELGSGIESVVAYLLGLGASTSAHHVTKDQFEEKLVGHSRPRSLAFDEIVPYLRKHLDDTRLNVLEIAPGTRLVPRGRQELELARLTDEALVLITGNGGCGKSSLLSQVLAGTMSATHGTCRLADLIVESGIRGVADLVNGWRTHGTPGNSTDTEEEAIARLAIANPGMSPPVLILGLDGVDQLREDSRWHAAARDLVRQFWRLHRDRKNFGPPPARLLVTCRSIEDVAGLISESGGTGLPDPKDLPNINLDQFTIEEFAEVCNGERSLEPEIRRSLSKAVSRVANPELGGVGALEIQTLRESLGEAPDSQVVIVVGILRHPVMWQRFLSLTSGERAGLLAGDAAAFGRLSDRYVDWFCNRAVKRHDWSREDLTEVLGRVARECQEPTTDYADNAWAMAVTNAGIQSIDSKALVREAASSGMINRERRGGAYSAHRWSWRHAFVVSHLVQSS